MTHVQQDAYGDAPTPRRGLPVRSVANGAGAILSVALVFGMGFWGYKLAVRDVSGVPVVRALEGPMRVAPEEPGGKQADYQGLAVNAVAAEGVAAPLPERVVLAPPPVQLDFSDAEMIAPGPNSAEAADNEGVAQGLWTNAAMHAVVETPEPARASVIDETEANAAEFEESSQDDPPSQPDTQPAVSADVPGVARSPIPQIRPEHDMVAQAAAHAASRAVAPQADVGIDPDSLSAGTRLVQLGAFDDRETARAEWDRLDQRFGAIFDDKGRVIQSAESGGRTFYRLRAAGFDAEAEARRFCAVLLAEQAACIPVLIR